MPPAAPFAIVRFARDDGIAIAPATLIALGEAVAPAHAKNGAPS
jgi:hypothetical protein